MQFDPNEWVEMCPENILSDIAKRLNYPPDEKIEPRLLSEVWGKYAEALTARHLLKKGFTIREWEWKPPKGKGEIDIIAQKGNRISFVEVRARCGKDMDPWDTIDEKKIRALSKGANLYLNMQIPDYEYQFDVALLRGTHDDFEFEYIEDAFLAPYGK